MATRVRLDFSDKDNPKNRSRTHSSFGKDADINTIMTRYKKTGYFVDPNSVNLHRVARFDDYSDIPEFSEVCNRVIQAEADFMRLPATTRALFGNQVSNVVEFVSDPKNIEQSIELGLIPADARISKSSKSVEKGAAPEVPPTAPPKGV